MADTTFPRPDDDLLARVTARAAALGQTPQADTTPPSAEEVERHAALLEEVRRIRDLTPPGPRVLAEDLIREARDTP